METDNEEEDIESETEEDRAFLDDEVEAQGPSFYRAFDKEREKESKEFPGYTDQKTEIKRSGPHTRGREHPLKKLRNRLEEYLKELLVLGVKEFLFPVLVKNEKVMFTIQRNNNIRDFKIWYG